MRFARVLLPSVVAIACHEPDGSNPTTAPSPAVDASEEAHEKAVAKPEVGLGTTIRETVRDAERGASIELNLGPLLGGQRPATTPEPGRYTAHLRAKQHRFLTMERTMSRSIDGGASLGLLDSGDVEGCVWAKTHHRSSTSKYASRDGKHHVNESDHESRLGMSGTWKRDESGPAVVVTLDRFDYRNCELGPDAREAPTPLVLHCFALAPGDGLPVGAVACRLDTELGQAETVALLLADTPRSGSWDLRENMTHRSKLELPADTKPWLLLGLEPGLQIRHDDGREREPLRVTLTAGAVTPPVGETPPPPRP